jgi:hypothetical protein
MHVRKAYRRLVLQIFDHFAVLDRTLFWDQSDLERKLETYKAYYNQHRCHSGLAGATPAERSGDPPPAIAKLQSYSWRQHCNGLFQTPVAT